MIVSLIGISIKGSMKLLSYILAIHISLRIWFKVRKGRASRYDTYLRCITFHCEFEIGKWKIVDKQSSVYHSLELWYKIQCGLSILSSERSFCRTLLTVQTEYGIRCNTFHCESEREWNIFKCPRLSLVAIIRRLVKN